MAKDRVTSLYDSTDKEIREAHNLEKMYVNVLSMRSKPALVIAEGDRAERASLDAIRNALHFSHTFCCLRGNTRHHYTKTSATASATYTTTGAVRRSSTS
jgi:hypothetical protein